MCSRCPNGGFSHKRSSRATQIQPTISAPWFVALIASLLDAANPAAARELRVCADPNNLPFSNDREEGLENRIVRIIAEELKADITYTWWAQRRGYLRSTLKAVSAISFRVCRPTSRASAPPRLTTDPLMCS